MRWMDPAEAKEAQDWHQHFALMPVWLHDVRRYAWLETVWRGEYDNYRDERSSGGWRHHAERPAERPPVESRPLHREMTAKDVGVAEVARRPTKSASDEKPAYRKWESWGNKNAYDGWTNT